MKKQMKKQRAIGFQLTRNTENGIDIPTDFWSFEILTRKVCNLWKQYNDPKNLWEVTPVYAGDIEEPTFRNEL